MKPDDLARIVEPRCPNHQRLVRVLWREADRDGLVRWRVECLQTMVADGKAMRAGFKGTCEDRNLRPLHKGSGTDETLTAPYLMRVVARKRAAMRGAAR